MTFVHPKSLQSDLQRLHKANSTSSYHASTVLSVLHDHLCKMLMAAPPGIDFFAYVFNQIYCLDTPKEEDRQSTSETNDLHTVTAKQKFTHK